MALCQSLVKGCVETTSSGPQGPRESASERGRGHAFLETFWASAQQRGTATPEGCSGKVQHGRGLGCALVTAMACNGANPLRTVGVPQQALRAPCMANVAWPIAVGGWSSPGGPVGEVRRRRPVSHKIGPEIQIQIPRTPAPYPRGTGGYFMLYLWGLHPQLKRNFLKEMKVTLALWAVTSHMLCTSSV